MWFTSYDSTKDLDVAWFQVKGIPLVKEIKQASTTLAVDSFSLKNVNVQIGNKDV